MAKRRSEVRLSILSPQYSRFVFQRTLDALNSASERQPVWVNDTEWKFQAVDCKERQQELRSLIRKWKKAGRNLNRLFKENSDLAESCTRGTTILIPDRNGFPQLSWSPDLQHCDATPQRRGALLYFAEFIVCPLSRSLEGPCKRCGGYYGKQDPRQTTYCSKRCSSSDTAMTATQRRRDQAYAEKLAPVQKWVLSWQAKARRGDWKAWVAARSGVDRRFISQAVTRGRLAPPVDQHIGAAGLS